MNESDRDMLKATAHAIQQMQIEEIARTTVIRALIATHPDRAKLLEAFDANSKTTWEKYASRRQSDDPDYWGRIRELLSQWRRAIEGVQAGPSAPIPKA